MSRQPVNLRNNMITLKRKDYDSIVEYAKEQLPAEACGLIAGTVDGNGDKTVEKV